LIKHRLYRYHASINKSTYVKDISKLGRDLSKTIIIDNVWENFQLQQENGIFIKTWLEDKNDSSLIDLMPLLKEFVIKKVPDVRKTLRRFRDAMIRLYVKGDLNPYETLRKYLSSDINEKDKENTISRKKTE
jgi:CTD small phosphatase-like protein 2